MELILTRTKRGKTYTEGRLYACPSPQSENTENSEDSENTEDYICDTLEPTWRDYAHGQRKIPGRSAIPDGRYAVVIAWDRNRGQWLPVLLGGPDFNRRWKDIRIHDGTCVLDTGGSILVGEKTADGQLADSRIWLHRLKKMIVEAKEQGEAVWITAKGVRK